MKQALCCSGANITDKHITDVSMCALFLLEAAKKCDAVFGVPPQSTSHTVSDLNSDIKKIYKQLLEKEVTTEKIDSIAPEFRDPTVDGLDTIIKDEWLKKQLQSDNLQNAQSRGEVDIIADIS